MSVPEGKVPILLAVRQAYTGAWPTVQTTLPYAALAAIIVAAGATAFGSGVIGVITFQVLTLLAFAIPYSAALRAGLGGPVSASRVAADYRLTVGSMGVIAFFLFIVFVVASIPGMVLFGMIMTPYADQLSAAGDDPAAQMEVVTQVVGENGLIVALLIALYVFIWLALTSRLFAVAPASLASGRVRSFETWPWTKGNMLRIMGARVMTLIPVGIGSSLVSGAIGAALGIPSAPAAQGAWMEANLVGFAVHQAAGVFLTALAIGVVEARLSAFLYSGLVPVEEDQR